MVRLVADSGGARGQAPRLHHYGLPHIRENAARSFRSRAVDIAAALRDSLGRDGVGEETDE